jgi:1,4-alpha-glucan branching enzyme
VTVGACCIVLHSHLPWVAHAGAWPVGEEWLHQAWSASYLPLVRMLDRFADEGRPDVLTLGVTPVLAAMLDDPYLLREFHGWLGNWQTRAVELHTQRAADGSGYGAALRDLAGYEHRRATAALEDFAGRWAHGGSPLLRRLADSGTVELLGGPATHPFQPLLDDRLVDFALRVGLDDRRLRLGSEPAGIWAPECGYRPGLEDRYAAAGVTHFLVDGPTLQASADAAAVGDAWKVGSSDVVAFGRDLEVTYRVWSPRAGYPGGRWYRDFHTFDHASGFRPARVTSRRTAPADKRAYEPAAALVETTKDAHDFVTAVVRRLTDLRTATGRESTVVVAYDTELFGHWWHEGPAWLEQVLRLLPEAGVRATTLRGAIEGGAVTGRAELAPGSWGSGKDWRVWDGAAVADIVEGNAAVQERLLAVVDKHAGPHAGRSAALDQLAREALLTLSSDWAFCVTKDSAAGYARDRFATHRRRFDDLADLLSAGRHDAAERLAATFRELDSPFGHLDARLLTARLRVRGVDSALGRFGA